MSTVNTIHEVSRLTGELTPRFGSRWLAFREACKRHGLKVPEEAAETNKPVIGRTEEPGACGMAAVEQDTPLGRACRRLIDAARTTEVGTGGDAAVEQDTPLGRACRRLIDAARTTEPGAGMAGDPLARAVARRIAAGAGQ